MLNDNSSLGEYESYELFVDTDTLEPTLNQSVTEPSHNSSSSKNESSTNHSGGGTPTVKVFKLFVSKNLFLCNLVKYLITSYN